MESQAATLRVAVVPRTGLLVDALLVCAGAAFVALCAQISFYLPGNPVPVTGQTFAVLLSGAALGANRGAAAMRPARRRAACRDTRRRGR